MARSRITYYFDRKEKVLQTSGYFKVYTNLSPFNNPNRFIVRGSYQSNQQMLWLRRGRIYRNLYNKIVCIRDLRAEGLI